MNLITPITLNGQFITLVPLSATHLDGLVEAASDGELWKIWYANVPTPSNMQTEIERQLNAAKLGHMLPFTLIDNTTAKVLGMTTYMNIDMNNLRLEIGSTWHRKSAQRTAANTEAKLLLLSHAFEELKCIAVEFRTGSFNFQSQKAIERLGAKLDGILRNHRIQDSGLIRDTYVYSIINSEWPRVQCNLKYKLHCT